MSAPKDRHAFMSEDMKTLCCEYARTWARTFPTQ